MAERRMFSKTIIDSDLFLDMPSSTQCLYFHLSMRADDDGFINNPKRIQRVIGSSDDDLKLLIAKNFIIPFESGVVVIKHWKIHNYIRTDRYKETMYLDEKAQLTTGKNKEYILGIPNDIPEVDNRDTQVRLGKYSIELDKNSIDQYINEDVKNDELKNSSNISSMSKLYQKNIGMVNGVIAEYIIEISKLIDVDLFKRAVEICTERNALNFKYLKTIITNWMNQNIFSYEQLQAYKLQQNQKEVNLNVRGRETSIETKSSNDDRESEEYRRLLEECRRLEKE